MTHIRAFALYSGGLDSILASRVIMNQEIEVQAFHFITPFFGYDKKGREDEVAHSVFTRYGISLKIVDVSDEYLKMVKHPLHGYGKNCNPCLDCKIMMVSKVREALERERGSFIITGEVLGQRPMSQRRDTLRIVERDSGAEGILLRPLSAKLLKPTIPEERNWVKREMLYDFSGRGRKAQMLLAQSMGINEYPTPAGGCLLADPHLASRFKWLFRNFAESSVNDVQLVTVGRNFVLAEGTLLVVGRVEQENRRILQLSRKGDILVELAENLGPLSLVRGRYASEVLTTASSITVRYSKSRQEKQVGVVLREVGGTFREVIRVDPLNDENTLESYRIT